MCTDMPHAADATNGMREPHYTATWRRSLEDPEAFWMDAAKAVDWYAPPARAFDPVEGWFPGGVLNTCHNCLDRHVLQGRGSQTALIYESAVNGTSKRWTFDALLDEVGHVAAMLLRLGVTRGDRVVIYMPMVPEAIFAMLACARIGAIHSVVFGGFAAHELAKRIDDARPKLLMTASCGIEGSRVIAYKPIVDDALAAAAHRVDHVLLLQSDRLAAELDPECCHDWAALREATAGDPPPPCAMLGSGDPLYILYTSGTTGVPKGVVRDNGGHAVALTWSMANIYGVGAGEVFWAASDVGWVVGHSYIVYAPLLVGATTILYEGKPVGTPDAGVFWRTIAANRAKTFFTAPTAIRAIRREDPDGQLLSEIGTGDLTAIFLAGERADPDTVLWLERHAGLPVVDHWWQTELGWPAIAPCMALGDDRIRLGSAGPPVPGYDVLIVDEDGVERPAGENGAMVIRQPLPPGAFRGLWNNPATFDKCFQRFPGFYETGDYGYCDEDGFVFVMGRTDDIINVAGHRLSTGQMEQIVAGVDGVIECAVIGVDDAIKGMVPLGFVVARKDSNEGALPGQVIAAVRRELGPVSALREVHVVPALPKTRSGKILRSLLRKIANGETWTVPPTIENEATPFLIADILQVRSGSDD
jgi:propionyl-CoA synthetase